MILELWHRTFVDDLAASVRSRPGEAPHRGGERVRALLFTNLYPSPSDRGARHVHRQLASELGALCDLTVAVPAAAGFPGGIAHRLLPAYAAEFGYA